MNIGCDSEQVLSMAQKSNSMINGAAQIAEVDTALNKNAFPR